MKSYQQHKSQLQEKRVAKDINGKVQRGSGSQDFAKGDIRKRGDIRIECKTTSGKSYILKRSTLDKIRMEAAMGGAEEWALAIEFQGAVGMNSKFAVIDWYTFLDLRNKGGKNE